MIWDVSTSFNPHSIAMVYISGIVFNLGGGNFACGIRANASSKWEKVLRKMALRWSVLVRGRRKDVLRLTTYHIPNRARQPRRNCREINFCLLWLRGLQHRECDSWCSNYNVSAVCWNHPLRVFCPLSSWEKQNLYQEWDHLNNSSRIIFFFGI